MPRIIGLLCLIIAVAAFAFWSVFLVPRRPGRKLGPSGWLTGLGLPLLGLSLLITDRWLSPFAIIGAVAYLIGLAMALLQRPRHA